MCPQSHIGQDVFQAVCWLPVSKRVDQVILNYVFKIKSGTSLDYMIEQFLPASSVHSYSTRFRENGCFSLRKVKALVRSLLHIGGAYYGMICRTVFNKYIIFSV